MSFKKGTLKLKSIISKDVFTLFVALNAIGYDDENNEKGMSSTRKEIRNLLKRYDWNEKYPQLKRIIGRCHQWHFLNVLLKESKDIRKNSELNIFLSELKTFSKEPLIQKLWKYARKHEEKETKRIYPLFEKEAMRLMKFIGAAKYDIKTIVLIVNSLDAYWRGYGFKIGNTGYVVVGPGAEKNRGELIRHELLHLLAPEFNIPNKIITECSHKNYKSRKTIMSEYIVRSLNLLYESQVLKKDISNALKSEKKNFPQIAEIMEIVSAKLKRGRR